MFHWHHHQPQQQQIEVFYREEKVGVIDEKVKQILHTQDNNYYTAKALAEKLDSKKYNGGDYFSNYSYKLGDNNKVNDDTLRDTYKFTRREEGRIEEVVDAMRRQPLPPIFEPPKDPFHPPLIPKPIFPRGDPTVGGQPPVKGVEEMLTDNLLQFITLKLKGLSLHELIKVSNVVLTLEEERGMKRKQ